MNIPYSVRDKNTRINAIPGMNFDTTYVNRLIKKVDANNAGNSNIQSANTGTGSVTRFLNGDPGEPIEDVGGVIETSVVGGNKTMEISTHNDHILTISETDEISIKGGLNISSGDITCSAGTIFGLNLISTGLIAGGSLSILSVASDSDSTHTLGRCKIGSIGLNDFAAFCHIDMANVNSYAIIQSPIGDTIVNAPSGRTVGFRINNALKMELAANGKLTVNSTITQNFDIITAATWSDFHLIPMFHTTSTGSIYTGVARKLSFTRDDNSRYSLRYKPIDSAYGSYGTLYTNTFAGYTFATLSDDRLKHNEKKITNGLDVIRRLEPQEYQKTGEMLDPDFNGDISGDWNYEAGFIAQEIKQIPEISYSVLGGDTIKESGEIVAEPYSVNYNNIFTYAVAGLKELDSIVTAQKSLIEKLEARLTLLENK